MMRHYRFAGVEISVDIPEDKIYKDEYRLAPFAVETVGNPQIYKFELAKNLDKPEGVCLGKNSGDCVYQNGERRIRYVGSIQNTLDGAYICVKSTGKIHEVQLLEKKFPDRIGTKTVLNSLDVPHLIAQENGFLLHCSYIEHDGKAILFTAPSETGKSTQADLWHELRNAEIINGDRAVVRIADDEILAEGIPFAGSSKYCKNRSLSIEAIVYLGQAPQTSICRLQGVKAFARLWEGISVNTWDKHDIELVSDAVQKIIEKIPVFHLTCTPDEAAVIALEQALRKENI
ncbi:MAG: hypothetical protein IJ024_00225 [Lachnospiraceae bacterium]|nr:hypothetical protein [Lachnospiraceae bacterium]